MRTSAALNNEQLVPQVFAKSSLSSQPYQSTSAERVSMETPTPDWLSAVRTEIEEFRQFESGWDSYKAKPISTNLRTTAFQLILDLARGDTPRPAVVPVSDGTIQFEWHGKGIDLEIRVVSTTKIEVVFEDAKDELEPLECEMDFDFRRLESVMNVLATR
jgi:hypothetical protein